MLRIGRVVILTEGELHDLVITGPTKKAKQQDAVIARQHDLLVQAEADRNVAQAAVMEGCELLREQQVYIDALEDRLGTILRHPASQPAQEGES